MNHKNIVNKKTHAFERNCYGHSTQNVLNDFFVTIKLVTSIYLTYTGVFDVVAF